MIEPPLARLELGQLKGVPEPKSLLRSSKSDQTGKPSRDSLDELDSLMTGAGFSNYQAEMGKMLKCFYSGAYNLYWCDT